MNRLLLCPQSHLICDVIHAAKDDVNWQKIDQENIIVINIKTVSIEDKRCKKNESKSVIH